MTRIFAATAILICWAFSIFAPAQAAGSRNLATDNGCFPWQDFKSGHCVAKPSQSTPPALPEPAPSPAPAVAPPSPPPLTAAPAVCLDGTTNVSGQCVCPTSTHVDATSGRCVADSGSPRQPEQPAIVCNGGTVTNGACACPQGFKLMPTAGSAAVGTCARTDADNCLGGELTVSGKCICSGQVTMDGETYLLEYSAGKCLPMRCPVTALHDGKCAATTTSAQPGAEPESTDRPLPTKEARERPDEDGHRRHCGHGMVATHAGCVAAHRRSSNWEGRARQYYRSLYPGSVTPPF